MYGGSQLEATNGSLTINGKTEAAAHNGIDIQTGLKASTNIVLVAENSNPAATQPVITLTGSNGVIAGGNVSITADSLNIATAVNANSLTGTVALQNKTTGVTVNLGGVDAVGSLGISSAELAKISAANTIIGSTSAGDLTVSQVITTNVTTGNLSLQTAANIVVDKALTMATGKHLTLNGAGANSTISQNAAITANGLELLGSNASHHLTHIGNQVTTLAANTKSVNYLNNHALILATVNTTGINATGDVSIATQTGNLTIAENVVTTATSSTAMILNAGKSASTGGAVGTDISGNIIVNQGKTVSVGGNGIAQLMTGSLTGDTTAAGLASAGHFRYNSDEIETNYSTTLSSGINVIYREKPTLTVNLNNAIKTYDGGAYNGGNGFTESTPTGLKNNDRLASATASAIFAGTAQNAKDVDTYTLSASENTSALGYGVTYNDGTLTIKPKELVLIASKTYDGNTSLTGNQLMIDTGVGSGATKQTLTYLAGSARLYSKNVKDNLSNYISAVTLQDGTNGGKASNYKLIAAPSPNNQVTLYKANATVIANSATVNYNGEYQTVAGFTATGLVGGETERVLSGVSAKRTEKAAGSYTTTAVGSDSNYNLNFVPGQFLIKATISPQQQINPVQSVTLPASLSSSTGGGSKVAIAAIPVIAANRIADTSKQCSLEYPETCDCKETLVPGIIFCLEPLLKH